MNKQTKYKFTLPIVHVVEFGMEIEVEASTLAEARKLALDANAESTEGYDWDRMQFLRSRIGNWQKITKEVI